MASFKPLAFNDLFPGLHLGLRSFGLKWKYEGTGYLVSFGSLHLIIRIHYADALWDLFGTYSKTASMHYPPIGRK